MLEVKKKYEIYLIFMNLRKNMKVHTNEHTNLVERKEKKY